MFLFAPLQPPHRWLDKLGLSAKYRGTHVFRQSFYGGNYALIDDKLNPNPVRHANFHHSYSFFFLI